MNAPQPIDWTTANQRMLVGEFGRLRGLLGEAPDPAAPRHEADMPMPMPPAIDTLSALFGLSGFERDTLLLAAGAEMDARLATLCGEANGAPQRPWPTFGLALAALPEGHWSALTPAGALRHWKLLDLDEHSSLTAARIRIDERILHYLAGLNQIDSRLTSMLQPTACTTLIAPEHAGLVETISAVLDAQGRSGAHPPVLILTGDDRDAQHDIASRIAEVQGLNLLRLPSDVLPSSAPEREMLARLCQREMALIGAALLIDADDDEPSGQGSSTARFALQLGGLVFVAARAFGEFAGEHLRFRVDKPDMPAQRQLWREALAGTASDDDTFGAWASRRHASARQIEQAAARIRAGIASSGPRDDSPNALGALARLIDARARWADLVLPEAQCRSLRQIAVHTRHRLTVLYDWGFAGKSARGLGIATLFCGESGTGKTLAAEVLAGELGMPLYRIDLSAVVSKYIGETEKNLRRVFDAAEALGAILLFDEADALFGKRSEVKDSHDRYANIEVSYLLQRMETYGGLAILTTNHKNALDTAFQRRLRFVVNFPFPDQTQRAAIWRNVFPAATPQENLDFHRLARLAVTGGTIRNIALAAAFLAAEAHTPVTMAHLLRAAQMEAAKREKPFSDAETRGWV